LRTNVEGRQWLTGLMRDLEKWTRAHDVGGWRYEFQWSNMAESFNKLLLGIRGMPVNAIVQFTFYKLVAWFNDRHVISCVVRVQLCTALLHYLSFLVCELISIPLQY
jgi:hypothetical protein